MKDSLRALIERSFSILSMYHGMLAGLIAIWVAAVLLSFIEVLSFDPAAMLVSLLTLVVSVGLSSWLIGMLFGVRAHGISSMITALILALIFTPTLEPSGLFVLAFVGLLAGASKYLLVYKGRHIFNPAAIAAVLIALTGLGAASWWVATPPLAVLIIAVGAVAIYKAKTYALVGTFLAVATPILITYFMLNDISLVDSFALLLSWPLFFFAGIMLTEPLTMPPKKSEQMTYAVIVGVLFALPLSIGSFEIDPAVALVVGNLFAALVAGRYALKLSFLSSRRLTPTTFELTFRPSVPATFEPGQYMEVQLPTSHQDTRGERRSFSVTSVPNAQEVTFGVKYADVNGSAFKERLQALEPGDTMQVSNLAGDFILPKDRQQKVALVAGGIGVTPFIGQLRALKAEKVRHSVTFVYTVRSANEIAYIKELASLPIERGVIVSPDAPKQLPKGWIHIKASRIDDAVLTKAIPDIQERRTYVSGPPLFVQSVRRLAKARGSRVKTDSFIGY